MNTKQTIITVILISLAIVILWPKIMASNEAYNAQVCSVNGYQTDCKTPLTPQQKCQNYYNEPCTIDGELPAGVTK